MTNNGLESLVDSVDFSARKVSTKSGGSFAYSKLILATGGTPRVLPLQGFKVLGNIFTLRTAHDTKKINDAIGESKGKKIVVIGSSFIGMEVANATSKDNTVTLVGMEKTPLDRILGEQVGAASQGRCVYLVTLARECISPWAQQVRAAEHAVQEQDWRLGRVAHRSSISGAVSEIDYVKGNGSAVGRAQYFDCACCCR